MGQDQSTNAQGPDGDGPSVSRRCYYEILNVQLGASAEEIRKAYRIKALELHPDRNYGDTERATRLFAELQTAFETLSDPQEKAWYDAHRASYLNPRQDSTFDRDAPPSDTTTAEDVLAMHVHLSGLSKASTSSSASRKAFKSFFDRLAREEEDAAMIQGLDIAPYPPFESEVHHQDNVQKFYVAWTSFATVKTFVWADRHRVPTASDRRMRRAMERENQKFRDEAIRTFNDAIRALVLFVRRRDVRYQATYQNESERMQQLRDLASAQAARSRAANQRQEDASAIPSWTLNPSEDIESDESSASEPENHIECVACNKAFKSENQYRAHENSKKHQKVVRSLRKSLHKEDARIRGQTLEPATASLSLGEEASKFHHVGNKAMESETSSAEALEDAALPKTSTDGAASTGVPQQPDVVSFPESNEHLTSERDVEQQLNDFHLSEDDAELISAGNVKNHHQVVADQDTESDDPTYTESAPRIGKAKQRRAKKQARKAAQQTSSPGSFRCLDCGESFASRTKLFKHISSQGHARRPI